MAWEKRERGGPYYTRSRKVDGRVVREYIGGGALGRLAAEADRIERERREVETLTEKREEQRLRTLVSPVLELCEAAEILAWVHLVAGGYRKTEGHWRRRREST